jgi:hypothetical protein
VPLVGFTIEIYHDTWPYERQIPQSVLPVYNYVLCKIIHTGAAVIQQCARFKAANIKNIPANSEYKIARCGIVFCPVWSVHLIYRFVSYLQFQKRFEMIMIEHNNNINRPSSRS